MVFVVTACVPPRDAATPGASESASASASGTTSAAAVAPPPALSTVPPPPAPPAQGPELPGGGRTIFPEHQLVGFCGTPNAPALGPLLNHPAKKAERLLSYANQYAKGRKILPVFELIAVLVQAYAGADGKYRVRVYDSVVDEYLAAARANKGLLLLNIQPGRSDFLSEVKRFEKYLREPDVGVALDPEWAVLPKQLPNIYYGQATGGAINDVITYLSEIVASNNLPEKVLVFHEVNAYVVKHEAEIKPAPGVVVIKSVDGWGPKGMKINTYNVLMRMKSAEIHPGFKLFFDEDRQRGGTLMTPAEVLDLVPPPEYVMYE
jgi:hypothetical protein